MSAAREHNNAKKKRYLFNHTMASEIKKAATADAFARANFHMYGHLMPTETGQMIHNLLQTFGFATE